MEPEGPSPPSQQHTNYPFPDPYQSFPSILSYLLKIQLMNALSSTRRFAIMSFFPWVSPPTICMLILSPPYVLYDPHNLLFLIY